MIWWVVGGVSDATPRRKPELTPMVSHQILTAGLTAFTCLASHIHLLQVRATFLRQCSQSRNISMPELTDIFNENQFFFAPACSAWAFAFAWAASLASIFFRSRSITSIIGGETILIRVERSIACASNSWAARFF